MTCPTHGGIWQKGCTGCNSTGRYISVAELGRIARTPILGLLCRRCEQSGIVNRRVHKIWHESGGGTVNFNSAKYDRLVKA